MVAETHLLVAEKLVMIERVPLIDRPQAFDVDRPVHDKLVHGPFEQIGEQEGERDRQPFERGYVMNVRDVDVEGSRTHRIDDGEVEVTVVPAEDAGAVVPPEFDLAL